MRETEERERENVKEYEKKEKTEGNKIRQKNEQGVIDMVIIFHSVGMARVALVSIPCLHVSNEGIKQWNK